MMASRAGASSGVAGLRRTVRVSRARKSWRGAAFEPAMRRISLAGAACALLAVALPAGASATTPTLLPAVKRAISAGAAAPRTCDRAPRSGRGLASTTYVAPMSGYVTTRLRAASGDWDLLLRDGATGRRITASQGFRSDEVAGVWLHAGARVVAQGCRRTGRTRRATVGFRLADVAMPKATAV